MSCVALSLWFLSVTFLSTGGATCNTVRYTRSRRTTLEDALSRTSKKRKTEQVYLNSLVLPRGWRLCLFPRAPEKGLKSVIAIRSLRKSRSKPKEPESNFGERWGERSRLTIVSEAVRVGSAKSPLLHSCGAFSRFSGEQKNLLTTDKSVQELRRFVIQTGADAGCRAALARGNSHETEARRRRARAKYRAQSRAGGRRRRLDFPANRSLCEEATMRACALVRRACGR